MLTLAQWIARLTKGYIKFTGKKPDKLSQLKIKFEASVYLPYLYDLVKESNINQFIIVAKKLLIHFKFFILKLPSNSVFVINRNIFN